eukprot:CAMPEP_0194235018 /NCGR_PEP_ID=MMETSP0158-20130606/2620_1 /TAXON_ID=33649 /ORGANISM="Thalassionema nitzschioides, Strain L26-B" /LENGTH=185 /DNA_ID=CAMNT_0038968365 /DNA_START=63 /DNA_END=620 /DNA_ORIENTATION=+
MNRQSEDLLEQFPLRRGDGSDVSLALQKAKSRFLAFTSSSSSSSSSSIASFSPDNTNFDSLSTIDPICIASIAGDSMEFRQLQEKLRKSKMITGNGAKQLMKAYVEKQGRQIEEKRNSDPELRKVKKLVKKRSTRSLMKKDTSKRDLMKKEKSARSLMKQQKASGGPDSISVRISKSSSMNEPTR